VSDGIVIANAPCSWGATDDFPSHTEAPGYAQVLDEIALAGYAGTELGDWGFLPTSATAVRDELSRRKLGLAGAFVPVRLSDRAAHAAGEDVAVRTARLLADAAAGDGPPPVLVLADDMDEGRMRIAGRASASDSLDDEGWRAVAESAERIARAVRDATGLRTAFHHHAGTHVETAPEVATLLDRTDAHLLGLCLDTGHYTYGEGDSLDAVRRYAERIWHVHAKDCARDVIACSRDEKWDYFRAVRSRLFCELGQGVVDLPSIMGELRTRGYRGWMVVEDEIPPGIGVPLESAQRDREYLRGLGFS
jgi:inosose dehydratase